MTENYKLVRLGEICEISTGSTDTKDATENGQYPLFDRSKKIKTSDKYLFDCEALIMPGEGAEFLPRHYIGKFDLHQRAYAMFNFSGLVNPKYLHFYLIAVKDYFAKNAVGATVKSLRRRHFTDLEVPLPSLEKQAETVEKLDSTFADIDLLEGNLELSDEKASQLLQSILSSAFAPVDESNLSANQGIAMTQIFRLDKIAEVGSGNSAPQKEELFKGGTLPFVRTSDVGTIHIGSIESSRDLLTPEGVKGLKLQPAGTILFPKSGASTFLNHRVLLSKNAYVSSHLATIKANNELAIDRYLFYFLQTIDARNLCQDQAYPSLNRDQIGGIEVPVPSLEKQHEIVKKLDSTFAEIQSLKAQIRTKKDYAVSLRQSLLSSAFTQEEAVA